MSAQLMVRPSSLMHDGVHMQAFGDVQLFRFTESLQSRMECLLSARKSRPLHPEEETELAGITELSRIFTFINAQLATQATWCPAQLEDLYDDEPNTAANTVIPQNI